MQHTSDFITLCNEYRQGVKEIDQHTLMQWRESGNPFFLIDVRDADETVAGMLPNATHISKGWIEAKIHHTVSDKNAKVVVYCGGGNRSLLAAYNLQKMGYTQVYSLTGGYKGWHKGEQHD